MNPRGRSTVLFVCALLFLFFFLPRWGFFETNRFFWSADDGCYLKRLFDFLRLTIDRPGVCETTENYFPIGAPIAWIPAALLAMASHALAPAASLTEWTIAWIAIEAFAFWTLACLLLERALGSAFLAIAAGIASSAFFYATHRQVLAHPTEWLAAAALVFFLKRRRPIGMLVAATSVCLARYHDIPALLLVAGAFADARAKDAFTRRYRLGFAVVLALFLAFTGWIAFGHGYGGVLLPELLRDVAWSDVGTFVVGRDWGILFTAPWFLAVLAIGAILFRRMSWTGRGAYVWMLVEAAICVVWRGNGSMFAYRYLTGAYAAAILVAGEAIERKPRLARPNAFLIGATAVWTLVLGHFYQGMLSLGIGMQIVRDAAGSERRIAVLPFFSNAMTQWGNFDLHRAGFVQSSALFVWARSLLDAGSLPDYVLVEGPTLFLLTLAVAGALVVAGLAFVRLRRAKS